MKALTYKTYGGPEVLSFDELPIPKPKEKEILVKVICSTVNRTDVATIQGVPFFARLITGIRRPLINTPGTEFSGIVEKVGRGVNEFEPGNRVFGFADTVFNCHGEYLINKVNQTALIPNELTFKNVLGVEGFHYGINFFRKINVNIGESALVNGATGAISSAILQIAKKRGLKITATCKKEDFEIVKKLGADTIINYEKEDFTGRNEKYDYIFDSVGKSSFFNCRKVLKKGGYYLSSDLGPWSQNIYLPFILEFLRKSKFSILFN